MFITPKLYTPELLLKNVVERWWEKRIARLYSEHVNVEVQGIPKVGDIFCVPQKMKKLSEDPNIFSAIIDLKNYVFMNKYLGNIDIVQAKTEVLKCQDF